MIYSTIIFDVKKKLGLSLREYIYLDAVYHLQAKTGWSFAKNEYYAEMLDVLPREVQRISKSLVENGLLVKSIKGVKTTDIWNDTYLQLPVMENTTGVSKMTPQPCLKRHPNHVLNDTHTIYKENDKESNTSKAEPCDDGVVSFIPLIIKEMESIDPKNKRFYGNKTQRDACSFLVKEYGYENVIQMIHLIPTLQEKITYMPSITTPVELRDKWVKIKDAVNREKTKNKVPEVIH